MILGIDASNIRGGGGVTHLIELLRAAEPLKYNFNQVIVWGGSETLLKIDEKVWLKKKFDPLLDKSLFHRIFWQKFKLAKLAKESCCDLLFIPGGTYSGNFRPFVTMSQNLLPFEWREIMRYGISKESLRLVLLRFSQSKTFLRAHGVVFLTNYARKIVLNQHHIDISKTIIINHGINPKFYYPPRPQRDFLSFTNDVPAKLLYVSFIGEYKHQWKVVEAITHLKNEGLFLELTLIGDPVEKTAMKKLKISLELAKKHGLKVILISNISYNEIQKLYSEADLFIFASSCETFGQILTEAMASSLPICCSSLSAMPELLGESGLYFNPEDSKDISSKIKKLIMNKELRIKYSKEVFKKSKLYSWEKCSSETFSYFSSVVKEMN
jgi:glycosyltransferase involved in cell wall biosynthesis